MCDEPNAPHPSKAIVRSLKIFAIPSRDLNRPRNAKGLAAPSFGAFKTTLERVEAMEQAITRYGCFASAVSASPVQDDICPPALGDGSGHVVLITGSTGNMGSRVLVGLLKDEHVKTVYAINRPSAGKGISKRQMERFEDSGLDKELIRSSKVVF